MHSFIRWVGHLAQKEETRNAYKFWSENLKGIDYLDVDGRIVLK
jgi:hypothetical protein